MDSFESKWGSALFPLAFVASFLALGAAPVAAQEAPTKGKGEAPIEVVADQIEYLKNEQKIVAKGNVVVTHKNYRLSADNAEVFTEFKRAYAEGHLLLSDGVSTLNSTKGYYDFGKHQGSFPKSTWLAPPWIGAPMPWYGSGNQIDIVSKNQINIYNAIITTCDFEKTHYDFKAERATVYPDDRIVLRNFFIRLLERPIFWLPYLSISLEDESPLEIVPGHSNELGYYVRTAKGMALGKRAHWKPHVDYFSHKGWGVGLDVKYRLEKLGEGTLRLYQIKDRHSPNHKSITAPYDERIRRRRARFTFRHLGRIEPDTTVFVNWHELSDEFFLRDFFEDDDRRETEPTSQVILTKNVPNYGLLLGIRKRTNRFYSETEELPRFRFTWKTNYLFDTPFLYTHEDEFVNFNQKSRRSDSDEDSVRLNTKHEISYPFTYWRLQFTPSVNALHAFYSKDRDGDENVTRTLLGNGVRVQTMLYRIFNGNTNFLGLDINRLRHVIEPKFDYTATRHQTGSRERIPSFDSVDGGSLGDTFTFSLDNRLQTKREFDGTLRRVDLVSYVQSLTYELKPRSDDNESTFTNWDHRVEVRPYDWLRLSYNGSYNFQKNKEGRRTVDMVLQTAGIEWGLSYAFIKDIDDRADESRQIVSNIEYKLNERWKIGGYIRADFQNEDSLREWELRAIRDLHDFLLTIGYNVRTSGVVRGHSHDREIYLKFVMKPFPFVSIESGNRAEFSSPRIGRYFSGSSER